MRHVGIVSISVVCLVGLALVAAAPRGGLGDLAQNVPHEARLAVSLALHLLSPTPLDSEAYCQRHDHVCVVLAALEDAGGVAVPEVQLHLVVTDVVGQTGMRIIRDILAGNHDPKSLANHRHYRCKASADEIAEALRGEFREELVDSGASAA